MRTIYDAISIDTGGIEEEKFDDLDWEGDLTMLRQTIITYSGMTIKEEITIVLLKIGYRPEEIARFTKSSPSSIYKRLHRLCIKIGV